MPVDGMHGHGPAWPWFLGAAAVYGGTVSGTWWPGTGSTALNLIPFRPHVRAIRQGRRTAEAQGAWRDLIINVVLLMPAALLLAQGFRRTRYPAAVLRRTLVLGFVGSVTIEMGQLFIPGRVPDATDVVLNTLGVGLSSGVVALCEARRGRRTGRIPG